MLLRTILQRTGDLSHLPLTLVAKEHRCKRRGGIEVVVLPTCVRKGRWNLCLRDTYFSGTWCLGIQAHIHRCHHRGNTKLHFYSSRAGSSWGPSVPRHKRCHNAHLKRGTQGKAEGRLCEAFCGRALKNGTKFTILNLSTMGNDAPS